MAKNSLRDKLDGDELDLSMMSLTEVPVKEISALPRASKIDLSSNQLMSLPNTFAQSLTNVTHLELGSNKIKELPQNFYKLHNLRHLDLYNNQLTDLPLSFCQLPSLKWLDLKGNPLNNSLRKVVGDCLNQRECEAAARNLVAHLKKQQAQMESDRQEKMRKEKEKEDARAKAEEAKIAKKRAEKKAAREKRKAEQRAVHEAQKTQLNGSASPEQQYSAIPKPAPPPKQIKINKSGGWSVLLWVNLVLFVFLLGAMGTGLYVYTDGDLTPSGITTALPHIAENTDILARLVTETFQPENLKQTAQSVGTAMSETSSHLWTSLQDYTGDLSVYTEPVVDTLTMGWLWLREHAILSYVWITNNVDWDSVLQAVKSAAIFMYEQLLVACEELSKNEALMSVLSTIRTHTAVVTDYLVMVAVVVWEYISHAVVYIQEKGPSILEAAKEQAAGALHTVKQSIQGLVK